jgi:hypothetical protein
MDDAISVSFSWLLKANWDVWSFGCIAFIIILILCIVEYSCCIEAKNSKIHISDRHMCLGARRTALLNSQFAEERICFPC